MWSFMGIPNVYNCTQAVERIPNVKNPLPVAIEIHEKSRTVTAIATDPFHRIGSKASR